jgi:hypothetical protein
MWSISFCIVQIATDQTCSEFSEKSDNRTTQLVVLDLFELPTSAATH